MSFQSQIWVLAEKPNLGILLCRRTIRLGNNFQSIYLYFWSNLDQLIRLFATEFDLWSVLNVFDKVLSNPNSSDFCDLIKNGIRFAFFLTYLIMSGGVGPLGRDDGASSSRLKGKKTGGGQSSTESFPNEKKKLSLTFLQFEI